MAERGSNSRGAAPALGEQPHESFLVHRKLRWLWAALALAAAASVGYRLFDSAPRPIGGTWYGYLLGVVGAVLIVWLTALGARKRLFTTSRWTLKAWVSAHVYLGLCLAVIVTLHTGFHFGWNVHSLAYFLMLGVIGSGLIGVVAYSTLPRLVSKNRTELTRAQMLDRIRELDARLESASQELDYEAATPVRLSLEKTHLGGGLLARLGFGRWGCGNRRALQMLRPARISAESASVIGVIIRVLDEKEAALQRARRHIRMTALMDLWLRIHVPLTVALLAALAAHIVSVFFYW